MAGSGHHLSGTSAISDPSAWGEGSPRGRFESIVELNRPLCREHYLLRLRIADRFPPTQPGQFVQLGCRPPEGAVNNGTLRGRDWELGIAEDWLEQARTIRDQVQPELCGPLALLRRPFSIAERGDDDRGTWLDVIHRVVGVGTEWLESLGVGDAVDLIGPLGNQFSLTDHKRVGLLVGGGVGLPPMLYLARALKEAGSNAVAFVGAQTSDLLPVKIAGKPDRQANPTPCVGEFARHNFSTVVTTDDGSQGLTGRITDGLERYLKSQGRNDLSKYMIFACGPHPMLHATARLAERFSVDCQVCVEQAMACGMGTCQSCVVKIRNEQTAAQSSDDWSYRLACTHGPVFRAASVL